jgi:hypothetical protein
MKKYRLLFTAVAVFAVVGSALAVKRAAPDIRFCNANNVCVIPPVIPYSTQVNGLPVNPGQPVYTGVLNAPCGSASCPRWLGNVYKNM